MALAYLRNTSISGPSGEPISESAGQPSAKKKLPKGKFSMLLGGNLIVWAVFLVAILDIDVHSMSAVPMPKIPQKLAVSGIVYNEFNPTVIISKQVYGEGEVVDGYTIVDISRTEVTFQKGDKTLRRHVR